MDTKHYTEVLIDGKIYTLGGTEDEGYMQRVASYINEMITTLKRQNGFTKQSAEYQTAMVELNMADDYFKARELIAKLEQQKHEMEKEVYSLKHELVTTQMKLEAANKEVAALKNSRPAVPDEDVPEGKMASGHGGRTNRTGSENKE